MNVAITVIYITTLFCTVAMSKIKIPKDQNLPENILKRELDEWSIPNVKFCQGMIQSSGQGSIFMPWWYNYCDRLWDQKPQHTKKWKYHIPSYQKVVENVQLYRKYLKNKDERDTQDQMKLFQKFG